MSLMLDCFFFDVVVVVVVVVVVLPLFLFSFLLLLLWIANLIAHIIKRVVIKGQDRR